ncbi:acyl-CoA desaturase [Emticicia sp. 21SJ11W-3]|uniref:acyl-CoA desaturase n=1 Tax=Emticicia sp. 21SJ11W-3 TaxID=2916755 RepID=UPI00209DED11|nr:acyl-CoA desaturase [Emticicia sp. 21SJ11W-3]UTA70296.1 acyl-CoA desaturase [Emticicia sp. 21SJ11W-3]
MVAAISFFIGHWYLSLFSQTFFLHRYSAHKMFTMNKFWERFFYFLTYVSQGSSYLNPRSYAILHRMHHAYSDTERDPHSPHHTENVFTMMWKTKEIYNSLLNYKYKIEERFEKDLPEWRIIDKIGDTWFSRVAWGSSYVVFYVLGFLYFDIHWGFFFLLPIHFLMGPIHGAIVNWSGHKYGYQNFDNKDESKNSLFFDFLMLGELFQNNHHKHPMSINFGKKWYEIDPTYPVIKFLTWTKIIKPKRAK